MWFPFLKYGKINSFSSGSHFNPELHADIRARIPIFMHKTASDVLADVFLWLAVPQRPAVNEVNNLVLGHALNQVRWTPNARQPEPLSKV